MARYQVRPALLIAVAVLALGAAAAFTVLRPDRANAGVILTVNSTSNTDDGNCEPLTEGDCTLHEAHDGVNAGVVNGINFDPMVFPPASPAEINIETGVGCLPILRRSVAIDALNAGVIIDGDSSNDETPIDCGGAFEVFPLEDGLNFSLIGGSIDRFIVRQFGGEGIHLGGADHAFGSITVDWMTVRDVTGNGISLDQATSVTDLTVTRNWIWTAGIGIYEGGGDGVIALIFGPHGPKTTMTIGQNSITAAGDAVDLNVFGNVTARKGVNLNVVGNILLRGGIESVDRAVEISYCDIGDECSITEASFDISVDDNEEIDTEGDAIDISVIADGASQSATATVGVNGNGNIASNNRAVGITLTVCCGPGGGNESNVNVTGNGPIIGLDNGVEIDTESCCGDNNQHNIDIYENGRIDGRDGVDIRSSTGEIADVGAADSNENVTVVQVDENGPITGTEDAVVIDVENGANGGEGNQNQSTVRVSENGPIIGQGGDGVRIDGLTGGDAGDGDENRSVVEVRGNGDVTGEEDGVTIDHGSGSVEGSGDGNTTQTLVDGNAIVVGGEVGVELESTAGGPAGGGQNSTEASVSGNAGVTAGAAAGVSVGSEVCCEPDNTNQVQVSGNGPIIGGEGSDGVAIDLGDSVNTIDVLNNAGITGAGGNALSVRACPYVAGEAAELDCIADSVTFLTVTGNDISDSLNSGIYVCCGAFELAGAGKSAISGNTISGNGEDGIEADSVSGLNIGPGNVISGNGTDNTDAGIEINNDTARAVWDDTDEPGDLLCEDFALCDVVLSAGGNRITSNSIFDNVGLGIDLQGLSAPAGIYDDVSRVGCIASAKAAFNPNDCVAEPVITGAAAGKAAGTACAGCVVELFLVDATPPDQMGPAAQHGEGVTLLATGTAGGTGSFSILLPCGLSAGEVSATATGPEKSTSEFSANVAFTATASCPAATATATNTVVAATATPTSMPLTPTRTATPQAKDCGDVNDNGSVDSIDASLVLQFSVALLDELENPASADVNGNGDITSIDAVLILQVAAALIGPDDLDCT